MGSGTKMLAISRPNMNRYSNILLSLNKRVLNLCILFAIVVLLFTSIDTASALTLDKTGPVSANLGETVTYTYTLSNDNGFVLHDIDIIDDKLGTIPFGYLANTVTRAITFDHKIVESDMPDLTNTAFASGFDPNDKRVTSNPYSHTIFLGFTGSLKVTKKPSLYG